jgi:ABC-type branched-subunit amino acid transport system permease subunit
MMHPTLKTVESIFQRYLDLSAASFENLDLLLKILVGGGPSFRGVCYIKSVIYLIDSVLEILAGQIPPASFELAWHQSRLLGLILPVALTLASRFSIHLLILAFSESFVADTVERLWLHRNFA